MKVPECYAELSSQHVLVMEELVGEPLSDYRRRVERDPEAAARVANLALTEILRQAADTCRARLSGIPGAELIEEIGEGLGPVSLDRRAMGEAVANLLANAVKYSPRDRCRLLLTGTRNGDELVVEVSYVGAPRYRVMVRAPDYKTAEEVIKSAAQAGIDHIVANDGTGEFVRKG